MAQSILMVQLYSNGDCLYATAIARQIKIDFPGAKLTWAIASFCTSIIDNNPFVDEIIEVQDVRKDDVLAYRKLKNRFLQDQEKGDYDTVFFTTPIDANIALYDGSIRSCIFNAYPGKITVPVQPVLRLYPGEITKVKDFAERHQLNAFKHVVLFEFAPQSGQSILTRSQAISIAEQIVQGGEHAVILSSAHKISSSIHGVIDGSELSIRETAALTHFCTFLLGTSSGITWASTSDAGNILPMVQLVRPNGYWSNHISTDFKRFSIPHKGVIEISDQQLHAVSDCVLLALVDFQAAKLRYAEEMVVSFKTTRKIVYNLLCFLQFTAIAKHIQLNLAVHGFKLAFCWQLFLGVFFTPFKLVSNVTQKHLMPAVRKMFYQV